MLLLKVFEIFLQLLKMVLRLSFLETLSFRMKQSIVSIKGPKESGFIEQSFFSWEKMLFLVKKSNLKLIRK